MPPGGRGRRFVGWGVVAWTGIGIGVLALALGLALGRGAGVVPYLVVASMVVFILNPAARARGPRSRAGRIPLVPAAAVAPRRCPGDACARPRFASGGGRPLARPGAAAARRLRAGPVGRLRGGVRGCHDRDVVGGDAL